MMADVVGIRDRFTPPRWSGVEGKPFEVWHLWEAEDRYAWMYDRGFRFRWMARLWGWRRSKRDGNRHRVIGKEP